MSGNVTTPIVQRLLASYSRLAQAIEDEQLDNPEIQDALWELRQVGPPHHLFFQDDDPNKGRTCGLCGLVVPAGCRLVHADWHDQMETEEVDV